MKSLRTSHFDSLPCVLFTNTALKARKVWVCTTAEEAELRAAELRAQDHIEDVETADRLLGDDAVSVGNPEGQLERRGWVKLYTSPEGEHHMFEGERPATEVQRKRILDYCLGNGEKLPWWMEKDDGSNG